MGGWVKTDRFYEGVGEIALRRICVGLAPVKVYMGVLDFLHAKIVDRSTSV